MASTIHNALFGNSNLDTRSKEDFKKDCVYLGSIFDADNNIKRGYERAKLSWGLGFQPAWDISTIKRTVKNTSSTMFSANAKNASENSLLWAQKLQNSFGKTTIISAEDKKIIQKAEMAFTHMQDLYDKSLNKLYNKYFKVLYINKILKYRFAKDTYEKAIKIIETITDSSADPYKALLLSKDHSVSLIEQRNPNISNQSNGFSSSNYGSYSFLNHEVSSLSSSSNNYSSSTRFGPSVNNNNNNGFSSSNYGSSSFLDPEVTRFSSAPSSNNSIFSNISSSSTPSRPSDEEDLLSYSFLGSHSQSSSCKTNNSLVSSNPPNHNKEEKEVSSDYDEEEIYKNSNTLQQDNTSLESPENSDSDSNPTQSTGSGLWGWIFGGNN